MTASTTHDRIRRYVIDEFDLGIEPAELAGDYDLVATGVVDSLGRFVLLEWLGREFGVPVDDVADTADVSSVDSIAAVVETHGW